MKNNVIINIEKRNRQYPGHIIREKKIFTTGDTGRKDLRAKKCGQNSKYKLMKCAAETEKTDAKLEILYLRCSTFQNTLDPYVADKHTI